MKNRNGFTLVELLAVIAILAILVIIALPNIIKLYEKAKKNAFLTEVKTIYKESEKKYLSESMKGKKIESISANNNLLDLVGEKMDYCLLLDNKGGVKKNSCF